MNTTFTKPATLYFFDDYNQEKTYNVYLDEDDLGLMRKFGATLTDHGDFLIAGDKKIKKVDVMWNEDETEFLMDGVVYEAFYEGGNFYTKV